MTDKIERTKRVQLRVSDDIDSRLRSIANELGMAPATVASYALSEFIVRKEREKAQALQVSENLSSVFGKNAESVFSEIMKKLG